MDRIRIYAKSAKYEGGKKEPLAEHTINDIKAGRRLVENLPFTATEKQYIGRLLDQIIAFHDVGKAATGFQASLEKDAPYWGHRHEILSAAAAAGMNVEDLGVFAIITHHKQIFPDEVTINNCLPENEVPYYPDHYDGNDYSIWQDMAKQWKDNLEPLTYEWNTICQFINRPDLLAKPLSLSPLSETMKHWLFREDQPAFDYEKREYASLLRGLTMSADHIASALSDQNKIIPIPIIPNFRNFNSKIAPAKPYGFQERAANVKGNLILRAPTGSGKTEAALMWASRNQQHNGRLFYALPTTASINAMYVRFLNIFSKDLVGLLHSRATSALYSMFERDGNGKAQANQQQARNLASLVREMYFPIRVCTPHQILRYSLQGKGWEAMLSEFPNSVLIFDEIHAYNPKLTGLTMATVRYLTEHKATCMFLTATLPSFVHKLIEEQLPGIEFVQPSYDNATDRKILEQKRHIVKPVDGTIMDNIAMIIAKSKQASSTLVVCNHVPTAQEVYNKLKGEVSDTKLLHSRFTRRDRNEKENELGKNLPKILVATQVVEVSLDLSFKQAFTEPAPIDALVQRMGRVNRRPKPDEQPATVHIFTEQYSDDNHVYKKDLRDRSFQIITNLPMPLSEEELNTAADKVYGKGYNTEDQAKYNEGLNYDKLKQFKDLLIAGTSQNWIEQVIEEQEGTIELLPEQLLNKYNDLKDQKLTIAANDLLVPVARRRLGGLIKDGRLDTTDKDLWILKDCHYSSEVGLEIDGEHTSYVAI